jgi:hypothetical protein
MVLWLQFGPCRISPFPNDQSVRLASVRTIRAPSFRTSARNVQIIANSSEESFLRVPCFFRHVSLSNKFRDAAVILFEIAARCTFSLRRSALVLAPPKQRIFDNALGSPCASPQSGAGANGLTKCARQMALITKTTNSGNLRDFLSEVSNKS